MIFVSLQTKMATSVQRETQLCLLRYSIFNNSVVFVVATNLETGLYFILQQTEHFSSRWFEESLCKYTC